MQEPASAQVQRRLEDMDGGGRQHRGTIEKRKKEILLEL